ncbi:unnamed protein product [Vitrella brassicaformis CCMP3155]|uniref:Uncharacterized protein n=1 Tax=Vitrella brassicaformis (strain CCMP3155) TaxID=1169540 RepID=A0A0G4EG40_VITBC|nr:unnamed protein product [Vitrella brassicaformis CCMP3155]|eukprot:CEL94351.1 unnamed protein product [Vitrella brassicaformis CCMP3155]
MGGERGRGLVCIKRVSKGATVLEDSTPIVTLQHHYSRRCCVACAVCRRVVDDFETQTDRILSNVGQRLHVDHPDVWRAAHQVPLLMHKGDIPLTSPPIPPPPVAAAHTHSSAMSVSTASSSAAAEWTYCERGCGEVFCSKRCKKIAWGVYADVPHPHRILCVDLPADKQDAWEEFKSHALRTYEYFQLAASVYAVIMFNVTYGRMALEDAMQEMLLFAGKSWPELLDVPLLAGGEHVTVTEADEYKRKRQEALEESLRLLKAALYDPGSCFGPLFTVDVYSRVVGQLDLTCAAVQLTNPLSAAVDTIMTSHQQQQHETALSTPTHRNRHRGSSRSVWPSSMSFASLLLRGTAESEPKTPKTPSSAWSDGNSSTSASWEYPEDTFARTVKPLLGVLARVVRERRDEYNAMQGSLFPPEMNTDDGTEDLSSFPDFEGVAVFKSVSFLNHSCDPTVDVVFGRDTSVRVVARGDMRMGSECLMSYTGCTEDNSDLSRRQHTLLYDYKFLCTCATCRSQAADIMCRRRAAAGGNTSGPSSSAASSLPVLLPATPVVPPTAAQVEAAQRVVAEVQHQQRANSSKTNKAKKKKRKT